MLFLMDYNEQFRLKLWTTAKVVTEGALLDAQREKFPQEKVNYVYQLDVLAFDWNCPKYITPRV